MRAAVPVLLLFFLLAAGWPAPACAEGDEAGASADQQGSGGESDSKEFAPPDTSKWPYPVSGYDTVQRTDRIFEAFPHNGAMYALGSAVSLGWQPLGGPVTVERYEVRVTSDQGADAVLVPGGPYEDANPTTVIFNPEAPGDYFWQVGAYLTDGSVLFSAGRRFTVLGEFE